MLEDGTIKDVEITTTVEADDLFGKYSTILTPENTVIYTEDKDMRMVPGWHLDWKLHTMHFVPEGTWEVEYNEKVFGRKWFWLQMLMGDQADNIPGLPNLLPSNERKGLIGPATAVKLLDKIKTNEDAQGYVSQLYRAYYGDDSWDTELLEQGILLWMRTDNGSSVWDVLKEGNPLDFLNKASHWTAIDTIRERIKGTL